MKKILIIEDSPLQRAVIVNSVKELGFDPLAVDEFQSSIIPLIKQHNVDLVLLDLLLVDDKGNAIADGFQLCAEIKNAKPKIKIIVITAESDVSAREFAELQGADAVITKPFQVDKLAKCIESIGMSET